MDFTGADPNDIAALQAWQGQQDPRQRYASMLQTNFDPSMWSGANPGVNQKQQQQPPAQKGNWFTHLLPTIGGVAGGLLTAPLEALDAVSGVGGTALNIAGAAGGSALGKGLENYFEGNNLGQGVGGAALEGGLGGVTGAVGGKVLGGILGKGAGNLVDNAATDLAGTTPQTALKLSTAGKLQSGANDLLVSQYKPIGAPTARSVNLPDTVAKLSQFGVIKPVDAERIAGQFTGGDGIVSKAVADAVGSADKFQITPDAIRDLAKYSLIDNQVQPSSAKAFQDMLDLRLQKMTDQQSPQSVMDVIRSLESNQADLVGKGGTYHLPTSQDKALARVHGDVAGSLKESLYGAADVGKVLTPDFQKQLLDLHPGVPEWQDFVNNQVMKSPDIGALRSTMAPFVNISKAINEGEIKSPTFGAKLADNVPNLKTLAMSAATSNPVKRVAAGAMNTVAPMVDTAANAANSLPGRIVGATAAQLPTHTPDFTSPQNALPGGAPAPGGLPTDPTQALAMAQQSSVDDPTQPGLSGYSDAELQQALAQDLQTGGQHASTIMDMIKLNASGVKSNAPTAAEAKEGDYVRSAAGSVKTAMQQLDQAGGANPVSNLLANIPLLGQFLEPGITAYNSTRKDAGAALAAATVGGKPTASGTEAFTSSLPSAADSPDVARQKYANLLQQLAQRGIVYGVNPAEIR